MSDVVPLLTKKWNREEYDKDYYIKNMDKIKERTKKYRLENKEKYKKWLKDWNNRYKDLVKEYQKNYYNKYYPNNKMKFRESDIRRRHNLKYIIHSFSRKDWDIKLSLTKGICPKCNKNVGINKLTLDHIIPVSSKLKSEYTINDVQPLCEHCNKSKGGVRNVKR